MVTVICNLILYQINCSEINNGSQTVAQHPQHTLTPLRLDVIATTGDHWLVLGLYRSALLSSVVSSLPPTE